MMECELRRAVLPMSTAALFAGSVCPSMLLSEVRPAMESSPARGFREEALWLERVREGDEEAARALVQRLYPTVLRSVRCHRSHRTSEEDLTQAVFAKIFAKLHQFSGRVPLEHWVSRITVNTCLSSLTREKVRPELRMSDLTEEDEAVVQQLLSTADELHGQQTREAHELLEKLLAALKPDERLVIRLLHLEERSTQQISRLTGWSVSRVKVKAFRARRRMRKLWNGLARRALIS
jgi:RNA polymerase sigma factor (sigma-70 family)